LLIIVPLIVGLCYHSDTVISLPLPQSYHVKQFPL
jgi:hypothetical protein